MKRDATMNTNAILRFGAAVPTTTIDLSAAEQEILTLSDKFLTNGFHSIMVRDVFHGRELMKTFLGSFNYYNEVACLSVSSIPLGNSIVSVLKELEAGGWLSYPYNDLSEFLCDHFYSDFLWIEVTNDLVTMPWYKVFRKQLKDLKFHESMPIMLVTYP
ncbi:hypothetical protein JW872_02690 [Candidatus Babeliales bacterium]|nr:hypothetical protein [Candidatus Babeliales bacterium]